MTSRSRYLPLAAAGKVFAFGLTEASAGSDAAGIKSIAAKQDDGSYILNGGKAWITNSGVADYYLIMAKTDPDAGARGISVFIVPKGCRRSDHRQVRAQNGHERLGYLRAEL